VEIRELHGTHAAPLHSDAMHGTRSNVLSHSAKKSNRLNFTLAQMPLSKRGSAIRDLSHRRRSKGNPVVAAPAEHASHRVKW